MSLHLLVARLFVEFLLNPALKVTLVKPYSNKHGVPGVRWVAELNGLSAYVSESRTTMASTPEGLATVLSDPESLDTTKKPIYWAYRRPDEGFRIEAWHEARWFQIFTPIHEINTRCELDG